MLTTTLSAGRPLIFSGEALRAGLVLRRHPELAALLRHRRRGVHRLHRGVGEVREEVARLDLLRGAGEGALRRRPRVRAAMPSLPRCAAKVSRKDRSLSAGSAPLSHCAASASRPFHAASRVRAQTATPRSICRDALHARDLQRRRAVEREGLRAVGRRAREHRVAHPRHAHVEAEDRARRSPSPALSTRARGVPMRRNSAFFFSGGSAGTGDQRGLGAQLAVASPCGLLGVWVTTPGRGGALARRHPPALRGRRDEHEPRRRARPSAAARTCA